MESLVATRDPVLQGAARIAGFAEAMVQDTETGKVVLCRHRGSKRWEPFGHLAPGECALNVFYGTAFWERADVFALFAKKEDIKATSLAREREDIGKDFRTDLHKQVVKRVDGKHDLVEALVRMGWVKR